MSKESEYAFPVGLIQNGETVSWNLGMTLRDWFAGMAMQGMIIGFMERTGDIDEETIANVAYKQADAMLKAQNQKPPDCAGGHEVTNENQKPH